MVQSTTVKGMSINDVTAFGGRGQGFYDESTNALAMNYVTMGAGVEGVKNCQKLWDVIYERPLSAQFTVGNM